jgi:hypothetical protein
MEFEYSLVADGAGGLVTRNRVSPYMLAAAGMPLGALPSGQYPLGPQSNGSGPFTMPRFAPLNEAAQKGEAQRSAEAQRAS